MTMEAEPGVMRPQPTDAWGPQELEEADRTLSWSLWRVRSPADTWISDFWLQSFQKVNFCYFKPLSLWSFVTAAPGHSSTH